ncbi:MAG: hypothetical protein OEN01_13815, partial [Candidatus Krumholzibacteria bacterium]|nr:hypothetical protein [Candidatus Krumholzibacteria bacterium]
MRKRHAHLFIGLFLLAIPARATAYNNPSLNWETIKTPHFEVHYHQGAEWTARQVAQVAEEVNGALTDLYQYEPDYPVHFVIRDTHDYANGAAYFYENKVEIWATNLEFGFRGTTNWIRNVVTHEYAHIISIQAATRLPKRIPALYFQLIGFEEEKRPDVLQGYPNNIISYPFAGVMIPPWFAEGVAQYQSPDVQYDCWDTHRDMILRCGVLDGNMLTYDEMSFFGKNGHQSEQVYDHGYGLVSYIASQYGTNAVAEIAKGLKSLHRLNMDGALKQVTGKSGKDLYKDWRTHLKARYGDQIAALGAHRVGRQLASDGYMTIAPVFSPDGGKIAYLSNRGSDFSTTSLYIMDVEGGEPTALKGAASSPPRFSPDGTKIVYSKKGKVNRYGSEVNDLFIYDIDSKKHGRLTYKARAADPSFSPDSRRIVCVVNSDGTHRMVEMDRDGGNQKVIFEPEMGTQLYNPHYSPDGEQIVFGIFDGGTRDIAAISAQGGDFRYVVRSPNDERNASWISDERIVFASDRTGIFNIYELDLGSGWIARRSNVVGGAFLPDVSVDASLIVYTGYGADGYGIYRLDRATDPVETIDLLTYGQRATGRSDECEGLRRATAVREGSGTALVLAADAPHTPAAIDAPESGAEVTESLTSSKYKSAFTPFHLYPRIVIWDGSPRFGLLASSFEILDKQSLFFGGSYGTDKEFDSFVSLEIRNLWPTLFAEVVYVRE